MGVPSKIKIAADPRTGSMEMGGGGGPHQMLDLRDDQGPGLRRHEITKFLPLIASVIGVGRGIPSIDPDQ